MLWVQLPSAQSALRQQNLSLDCIIKSQATGWPFLSKRSSPMIDVLNTLLLSDLITYLILLIGLLMSPRCIPLIVSKNITEPSSLKEIEMGLFSHCSEFQPHIPFSLSWLRGDFSSLYALKLIIMIIVVNSNDFFIDFTHNVALQLCSG